MKRTFTAIAVATVLVVLTSGLFVKAANSSYKLNATPDQYELSIKPGASLTKSVTLKNTSSADINYQLGVEDFNQVDDQGKPVKFYQPVKDLPSLANWVTFENTSLSGTLKPDEAKVENFTVIVPTTTKPGGFYASVFAKISDPTATPIPTATATSSINRVDCLLFLSVTGEVAKTLVIDEFKAPTLIWKGPINFEIKLKNTGDVHYTTRSIVRIKSRFGSELNLSLGEPKLILPDHTLTFSNRWSIKYPLGPYQLTAVAIDGNGQEVIVTQDLMALPLAILIPFLLLLMLIATLATLHIRHKKSLKQ